MWKGFKNTQGLGVHKLAGKEKLNDTVVVAEQTVLPASFSDSDDVENEAKNCLNYIACRVEERVENGDSKKATKRRGANRRESHSAVFKAKVIHECQPGVSQYNVPEKFSISQSLVSKWVKDKNSFTSGAAQANKKLLKKQRLSRKYNELYASLLIRFREARSKGHYANFNWLWSRARVIYREQQNDNSAMVKKHLIVAFLKRFNIRQQSRLSNESFRTELGTNRSK